MILSFYCELIRVKKYFFTFLVLMFDLDLTPRLEQSIFQPDWLLPCILFISIKMYKDMKDHPRVGNDI